MGAFKRCDYCGRTVNWNDVQERRTWLELHWDVLDEGHPEQVWDFCSWDCAVNFGLSRRKGPVGDLVRELGDRVVAVHPRIAAWRDAFSAFGARPSKFQSSVEALVRRARRGDELPAVNLVVGLYNATSLGHLVPIGGDDLERVDGGLHLRRASGG